MKEKQLKLNLNPEFIPEQVCERIRGYCDKANNKPKKKPIKMISINNLKI